MYLDRIAIKIVNKNTEEVLETKIVGTLSNYEALLCGLSRSFDNCFILDNNDIDLSISVRKL